MFIDNAAVALITVLATSDSSLKIFLISLVYLARALTVILFLPFRLWRGNVFNAASGVLLIVRLQEQSIRHVWCLY
jgi:hypothetical protein